MHLALACGTRKSFRVYLYIKLNIFILPSKCPLSVSVTVVKQWLLDISFFFFSIAERFGLVLMWISLCLQSNMNLGCFEVMVGRGGPECDSYPHGP